MRKAIIFLLICAAALSVTGVSAYYIARDAADNIIHVGSVTTGITEEFDPPGSVDPGSIIHKDVRISNTGADPCFVRVQALFSDGDMQALCSVNYNTADWEYRESGDGGWWYCRSVLPSDETTPPLFTEVVIDAKADPASLKPFDILIRQESRQSYGADTWQAAWK